MAYLLTFLLVLAPALGEPRLLWSAKMALVGAFTLAALVLQPKFAAGDSTSADRGTARAFTVILAPYLLLTVLEARFLRLEEATSWGVPAFLGLAFAAVGLVIRTWAVRTLGRFFTLHVQAQADHMVVRTGPYKYVRHPSYTGALLMLVGMPVMLGAWASALAFGALFLGWTAVRMRQEEAVLEAALGAEYAAYRQATPALVPFT